MRYIAALSLLLVLSMLSMLSGCAETSKERAIHIAKSMRKIHGVDEVVLCREEYGDVFMVVVFAPSPHGAIQAKTLAEKCVPQHLIEHIRVHVREEEFPFK